MTPRHGQRAGRGRLRYRGSDHGPGRGGHGGRADEHEGQLVAGMIPGRGRRVRQQDRRVHREQRPEGRGLGRGRTSTKRGANAAGRAAAARRSCGRLPPPPPRRAALKAVGVREPRLIGEVSLITRSMFTKPQAEVTARGRQPRLTAPSAPSQQLRRSASRPVSCARAASTAEPPATPPRKRYAATSVHSAGLTTGRPSSRRGGKKEEVVQLNNEVEEIKSVKPMINR